MNMIFTSRLCSLRKERGLSQKTAAASLGVSQALLSHYEKGIRECGLDFVIKASEFYSVTCDYLLGRSDSRLGFDENLQADMSDDSLMTYKTVMRAAIAVTEILNAKGGEYFNAAMGIYSINIYKLLLVARSQGLIDEKLFKLDSRSALYSSMLFIDKLENDIRKIEAETPTELSQTPQSIKTVIAACEKYMSDRREDIISF